MRYLWVLVGAVALAQVDPRADQLVRRSRKKLKSLEFMTVQFTYSVENRADTTQKRISRAGTLWYRPRQNKFRIDLGDVAILSDGKTVWQFLKKEREVNISSYDPKEGFSLDRVFRVYDQDMKVRFDKTETVGGRSVHKVSLFPISDTTEYFRVEVWIDPQTELPQRMRLSNRDGTVVEYQLKGYDTRPLADSLFVFDVKKHPGVQVIDLR